jgi:hypothetical protein
VGKLTSQQKAAVVQEYLAGHSVYRLARLYQMTENSIRSILKVRKVSLRGKRKYGFDESFFDEVGPEGRAYWLGFLYAEGNLHRSTLAVKLAGVDLAHLLALKQAVQAQQPVCPVKDKGAYVLKLSSTRLVPKLNRLGIVPNKNAQLRFPPLSDDLKMHFVRGFFDGDGWFAKSKPNNMKVESWQWAVCSRSREFLEAVREVINLAIGRPSAGSFVKRVYRTRTGDSHIAWTLTYGGNPLVRAIRDALYHGATVFLPRKYEEGQRVPIHGHPGQGP